MFILSKNTRGLRNVKCDVKNISVGITWVGLVGIRITNRILQNCDYTQLVL